MHPLTAEIIIKNGLKEVYDRNQLDDTVTAWLKQKAEEIDGFAHAHGSVKGLEARQILGLSDKPLTNVKENSEVDMGKSQAAEYPDRVLGYTISELVKIVDFYKQHQPEKREECTCCKHADARFIADFLNIYNRCRRCDHPPHEHKQPEPKKKIEKVPSDFVFGFNKELAGKINELIAAVNHLNA